MEWGEGVCYLFVPNGVQRKWLRGGERFDELVGNRKFSYRCVICSPRWVKPAMFKRYFRMDEIGNYVATRQLVSSREMTCASPEVTINIIWESVVSGLGNNGDVVHVLLERRLSDKSREDIEENEHTWTMVLFIGLARSSCLSTNSAAYGVRPVKRSAIRLSTRRTGVFTEASVVDKSTFSTRDQLIASRTSMILFKRWAPGRARFSVLW